MTRWLAFREPVWLLLLIPAGLVIFWLWRGSLNPLSRTRAGVSLALRLAVVALVAMTMAGPLGVRVSSNQCVIFVMDISDSIPSRVVDQSMAEVQQVIANRPSGDRAGLVIFGDEAVLESFPTERPGRWVIRSKLNRSGTDIAGALRLAAASFPEDCRKKIVLVSDGNETREKALEVLPFLRSNDIRLDVREVSPDPRQEVVLEKLVVPAQATRGESIPVQVTVRANFAGEGRLGLRRGDQDRGVSPVKFVPGKNTFVFEDVAEGAGMAVYEALLEAPTETGRRSNNRGEGFTWIRTRPTVLVVRDPVIGSGLGAMLAARGFTVEEKDPATLPVRAESLLSHNLVIFDNVDAAGLVEGQMAALATYVRELGGGFLAVGGDRTFGAGGWFRTPLEEILPVSMDLTQKKYRPKAAIGVVVDGSGSMSAGTPGATKIKLAAEGAVRIIELLMVNDRFGLNVTDTEPSWPLPFQAVTADRSALISTARGIDTGGGGIYVYTGLESAYNAIAREDAQVRHLILFADTADAEQPIGNGGEHVFDMATRWLEKRITLSVVGIGMPGDADIGMLTSLARSGGGRYYFTQDRYSVPRIFSKDAMIASRAVIVEKRIEPAPGDGVPFLKGISALPAVEGYVVVSAKPGAVYPSWATSEDPLLASWSIGLGRSVAFTSDSGRLWSKGWAEWPDAGAFWSQITKWLGRDREQGRFPARLEVEGGRGRITVEAIDEEGRFENFMDFRARVLPPGKDEGIVVALSQTAPGRYEATFPAEEEGSYRVHLFRMAGDGTLIPGDVMGVSRLDSPEFRVTGSNRALLDHLAASAGGKRLEANLEGVHERGGMPVPVESDIGDLLLLLALILFLVDVAIRRVDLSPSGIAATVRTMFKRMAIRRELEARDAAMDQLLVTKKSMRVRRDREREREAVPVEEPPAPVESPSPEEAAPEAPPPAAPVAPEDQSPLANLAEARKSRRQRKPD